MPTSGTVLIVDPDAAARAVARRILEAREYRVLDAGDPAAAERLARLFVGPIHAVLVEVQLAGASPAAFVDRLRSLRPELGVLFTSGRPHAEIVRERIIDADHHFIDKPFTADELITKIEGTRVAGR